MTTATEFRARLRQKYFDAANIPAWVGDYSFDDLDSQVRLKVEKYVEKGCPGAGLVLWGRVGRGKTTAALVTLREILRTYDHEWLGRTWERHIPERPGYYISYAEFIRTMKRSWDEDAPPGLSALIESLFYSAPDRADNCRVLVLDDVGKEVGSNKGAESFAAKNLHDLLRARHDKGAPTIITTNLTPDAWSMYGPATESFVNTFAMVEVAGKDHRRP